MFTHGPDGLGRSPDTWLIAGNAAARKTIAALRRLKQEVFILWAHFIAIAPAGLHCTFRLIMKPAFHVLLLAAIPAYCALDRPVRIDTGLVQGVTTGTITAYKGIPFAAPPVGDLRWREPRPPASWQGVRPATRFSADCFQAKSGALGPWSAEFQPPAAMEGGSSEDCLYLNVWTPAAKAGEKRPVFVWIHGGAFTGGSGAVPIYNGEGLASKGLVMVTINYRLGVFGFLAHPELTAESAHHSSGNYALLDMIAALQWVHRNIAAFGGDPANVTIAGQSAGAFAVNYLVASPLAKGLFHRAIAESGAAVQRGQKLSDAEAAGARQGALAELRARPPEALLRPAGGGGRPGPIVDGWVIPDEVRAIFEAGRQNDVPLLTGWNADDGVSFGAPPKADAFRENAKRIYGDMADAFLKAFPASTDEETPVRNTLSAVTRPSPGKVARGSAFRRRRGNRKSSCTTSITPLPARRSKPDMRPSIPASWRMR